MNHNLFDFISDDSLGIVFSFLDVGHYFGNNRRQPQFELVNRRWNHCITIQASRRTNCIEKYFLTVDELYNEYKSISQTPNNSKIFDFRDPNGRFIQPWLHISDWQPKAVESPMNDNTNKNAVSSSKIIRSGPIKTSGPVITISTADHHNALLYACKDNYSCDYSCSCDCNRTPRKTRFALANTLYQRWTFTFKKSNFDELHHVGHDMLYKLVEINLQKLTDYYVCGSSDDGSYGE